MFGITFAAREMPLAIQRCENLVLSSQELYFSYSSFPSHKYLLNPFCSMKVGTRLACWFVDFDSKLGSSGQFNFKKVKYLSIFHRKLRVFLTPGSPAFSAVAVFARAVALLRNALSLRALRSASPAAFIPLFLHSLIALFFYCSIPSFLIFLRQLERRLRSEPGMFALQDVLRQAALCLLCRDELLLTPLCNYHYRHHGVGPNLVIINLTFDWLTLHG